jgi:DNA polymerase III sliding clamp (beta) subunit (PCNA family)
MKIPIARMEKFVVPEKDAQGSPMQYLWLDVEGRRIVATDGYIAARQTVEVTDEDITGLIPIEALELARKELKIIVKATDKESIPDSWLKVVAGEDIVVVENLLTTTTHLVKRPKLMGDAKFPIFDAVFPSLAETPTIGINGEYLATVISALSAEGYSLNMWATAADKALAIASDSGKALAVIMPMRTAPDADKVSARGTSLANQEKADG